MTPAQLALADMLLTQGLTFWSNFQAQKNEGTLTEADLDAALSKLDADFAQLLKDRAEQKAREAAVG